MKFYANHLNGHFLRDVLPQEDDEVDFVKAAIAYGDDATTLIENCLTNKYRLDIWMRYDHTVPVSPQLLRKLLKSSSSNIFCKLVPDVLHSKVIWWKGFGAYIGSANLTERAWITNIEFGVFISESELELSGNSDEFDHFFHGLEYCEKVRALTAEIVEEQENIKRLRSSALAQIDRESRKKRLIGKWGGPTEIANRINAVDTKREKFILEWEQGLTHLRDLAELAPSYRPSWLNSEVPPSWQADQFLHWFYFNEVVEGGRHPYEERFLENRADPSRAVRLALEKWASLPAPLSDEDKNCHVRAPTIRRLLAKERISEISLEDFRRVCRANHSTADHVRRMRLDALGLPSSKGANEEERIVAFADWLWRKRNSRGESAIDLLQYVFEGGEPGRLPHRIFEATQTEDRRLPHFGINQVAELAGWARPELCPPRNGRTSKGLRALGFDVRIY